MKKTKRPTEQELLHQWLEGDLDLTQQLYVEKDEPQPEAVEPYQPKRDRDMPVSRTHADITFIGQAFQPDEAGKTACAVAALRHFAAVGVKDPVVEIQIRIVGRFDDQ